MFQKLRTDLTKELKNTRVVFINLNIFKHNSKFFKNSGIWEHPVNEICEELGKKGIALMGYANGKILKKNIPTEIKMEILKLDSDDLLKSMENYMEGYNKGEIVCMGFDITDLEFTQNVNFLVVPFSSNLELKMQANYVSNFDGLQAFVEIGHILLGAKTNLNGYSK